MSRRCMRAAKHNQCAASGAVSGWVREASVSSREYETLSDTHYYDTLGEDKNGQGVIPDRYPPEAPQFVGL